MMGDMALHGPHHVAQKSTIQGVSLLIYVKRYRSDVLTYIVDTHDIPELRNRVNWVHRHLQSCWLVQWVSQEMGWQLMRGWSIRGKSCLYMEAHCMSISALN